MQLTKALTPILGITLTLTAVSSQVKIVTSQEPMAMSQTSSQIQISSNIFPIKLNGKWRYLDRAGKIVIQPQFDYHIFSSFSNGLASVRIGDNAGYIDRSGKLIIPLQFDYRFVSSFSEGLAGVIIDNKTGYIDRMGKLIIKPQFNGRSKFQDGLAIVKAGSEWGLSIEREK